MAEKKDQFERGQTVQHRLQREWLMIVGIRDEEAGRIYECRTKQLEIKEFKEFELEKCPPKSPTGR
jgi:hypothetical protein